MKEKPRPQRLPSRSIAVLTAKESLREVSRTQSNEDFAKLILIGYISKRLPKKFARAFGVHLSGFTLIITSIRVRTQFDQRV